MDRRTFLMTTGAAAAAGPLLAELAEAQQAPASIQHVVLVMMENRSFDHILGWLPGADGRQAGLAYLDNSGNSHSTYPLAPDFTGCDYNDPDHSYAGARQEVNGGSMDGWLRPGSNDIYSIGYYTEADLPFRSALARNYTTCDRYFASVLGPTFPNRIFQHAGQTDRLDDGFQFSSLPTIWDNLQAAGISNKYYFNNIPFLALWGLKYAGISALYSDFLADCASGNLPAVSFVDPSYTTFINLDDDDHPHSDVRNGDAFLSQTFQAVANSPNWPNTVFIVNCDEWGGFYDHVPPPRALAPNTVDLDLVNGKALLGCRVPCIVASPWTRGNPAAPTVNHTIFDHTSVLKLIESVWAVPPVAARESSSDVGNLLSALNLGQAADPTMPALPNPDYVWPSSFCFSSINPSGMSSAVPAFGGGGRAPSAFQAMRDSGMLKGFPGYR